MGRKVFVRSRNMWAVKISEGNLWIDEWGAIAPFTSMPDSPTAEEAIAIIRGLMSHPPGQSGVYGNGLHFAIHQLGEQSRQIARDPELMSAVMQLSDEIADYRGKGCQIAAKRMTQVFGFLTFLLVDEVRHSGARAVSFTAARESDPSAKGTWEALERLAARAVDCIAGSPSRSQHTDRLRCDAWTQLSIISEVVREPAHLELALKTAGDGKVSSDVRECAVDFITEYWGEDEPDEATVKLLSALLAAPSSRELLVSVLQAQIDLGLSNEFSALEAVGDWDDEEN